MTFIDEELEILEQSPDYRRFLKVYIKYQMYALCQKLADVGEESFVVTASVSDGTFSHVGSSSGDIFLNKSNDINEIKWKFLSFCSSADHLPDDYASVKLASHAVSTQSSPSESEVTIIHDLDHSDTSQDVEYTEPDNEYPDTEHTQDGMHYTEQSCNTSDIEHTQDGMRYTEQSSHTSTQSQSRFKHNYVPSEPQPSEPHHWLTEGNQDGTKFMDPYSNVVGEMTEETTNLRTTRRHLQHVVNPEVRTLIEGVSVKREENDITARELMEGARELMEGALPLVTEVEKDTGNVGITAINIKLEDSHEQEMELYMQVPGEYKCTKTSGNVYTQGIDLGKEYQNYRLKTQMRNRCSFCEKFFYSKSHLTRHLRTHTGERPFRCSLCHRAFNQEGHLAVHMRLHTGEKPFQCEFCDKSFVEKKSLIWHQSAKHSK